MNKETGLLSHSIFEKPFMDSRVKTRSVSKKERILGHLIGPLGLIFVVNTIAALVEKFFTQQTGAMYGVENVEMIKLMGGRYEVVMTTAKILAVGLGLLNGWLIQHTNSRQGRMRPWHLIFGFVSIAIGALIFLFPGTTLGENYWYYFFFLLTAYHTVGSTFFYLFRDNICSLTTRDPAEKTQVQFIRKMSWTLISGVIIGMIINMVLLPMWLEKDIHGYAILMVSLSIAAIPLLLLEYFYTRERITEDVALEAGEENENRIPLRDQMKALFSNKYFVLLTIIATVGGIVDSFKGGNVQYFYIKVLLGGAENPMMYTIYQIATGVPLTFEMTYARMIRRHHRLSSGQKIRHPQHHLCRLCACAHRQCAGLAVPLKSDHRHRRRVPQTIRHDTQRLHLRDSALLCLRQRRIQITPASGRPSRRGDYHCGAVFDLRAFCRRL